MNQIYGISDKDRIDRIVTAGPLNLDRHKYKAFTIMGDELALTGEEFDILDKLVAVEGESLTFRELYSQVWIDKGSADDEVTAFMSVNNVVNQINDYGGKFMWVEDDPETGYTFKTKWGRSWH